MDVHKTDNAIKKQIHKAPQLHQIDSYHPLFRPPYGKFKMSQAKQLLNQGYKVVLWDVLSFDWDANTTPKACYNNVIENIKKGSIVVFHDSLKAELNLRLCLA